MLINCFNFHPVLYNRSQVGGGTPQEFDPNYAVASGGGDPPKIKNGRGIPQPKIKQGFLNIGRGGLPQN